MATHENQQSKRPRRDEDVDVPVSGASETTSKADLDTEVDSLLDEIDEILEVNAEDFVKSFVQKGGQ